MEETNIILAKTAGFCFGVERALNIVEEEIEKKKETGGPLYTYGPIIHNETVVGELVERGVSVMEEGEEASLSPGTVVLRSHGVSKNVEEKLKAAGHEVIDATCPFVKKIHRIVREHGEAGEHIVIIGNREHPEVRGIMGHVPENVPCTVIDSEEEARSFSPEEGRTVCLVSQTTYNHKKFQDLVEIVNEKGYSVICLSTICNATGDRQTEASQIATQVDVMLCIGSKSSSNSRKLFELCSARCDKTFFIQTAEDLPVSELRSIHNIGITAGASTPNKIIEEVQKKCQKILNKC